ncbi:MAG: hypothetical protein JWM67_3421 [Mycobacterium sp.]|nr:hypothetical protein [Mycobacterium sp.]
MIVSFRCRPACPGLSPRSLWPAMTTRSGRAGHPRCTSSAPTRRCQAWCWRSAFGARPRNTGICSAELVLAGLRKPVRRLDRPASRGRARRRIARHVRPSSQCSSPRHRDGHLADPSSPPRRVSRTGRGAPGDNRDGVVGCIADEQARSRARAAPDPRVSAGSTHAPGPTPGGSIPAASSDKSDHRHAHISPTNTTARGAVRRSGQHAAADVSAGHSSVQPRLAPDGSASRRLENR